MQTSFHNPSGREPHPKLGRRQHSTRGTTMNGTLYDGTVTMTFAIIRRRSRPTSKLYTVLLCLWRNGACEANGRHGCKLQCHTCQSFGHKSKFCQYYGHGNDARAAKVNSLHSHACAHVTPLGNDFTVLNSINGDGTVFNLNQDNTSE